MKSNKLNTFLIFFCLFTFAFSQIHAQESKKVADEKKNSAVSKIEKPIETQAVEGDVIFSDGTNQLLRITDEGTSGAIQFTDGVPSNTTNKLYRSGTNLYFGNANLNGGGGTIDSLDQLSDAKTDAFSIFLGKGSGISDDGGVSIGFTSNFNTALGYHSLFSNTTGIENVAIGILSLNSNSTGWQNSAIGKRALTFNTTGYLNTATGANSLADNITGNSNSAYGAGALNDNTAGNDNTGIGNSSLGSNNGNFNTATGSASLHHNTTGNKNVGIGYYSNFYNQTGSKNTIVGNEAGSGTAFHNKSGNIFLGYKAGYFETGNNKLYINNDSSSFPLIWGDFTDGSELVKINGDFHVTGNITSDGTSVIVSAINDLTDAKTDGTSVFLGYGTGNLDDGSNNQNTAIGIAALNVNSSGAYNTALGYNSLKTNQTGNNNIGIGVGSIYSNISGHDNISIGNSSLSSNTAGHSNVSIGSSSLYSNSGNQNTAVGFEAARNNVVNGTTAIGHNAMYANTTGTGNTATGYNALKLNTTGVGNTANGYEALTSLTLGNFNTAIGHQTLNSGSFIANNTAVGYNALNQSNGEQNTAVGSKALETNGGSYNSAFGASSLLSITGSYNSAFGSGTFVTMNGDSNSAFGYQAGQVFSGNQNIAIGSGSLGNGTGNFNLGIGNSSGNYINGSKNIFIGHEAGYHGISNYYQNGSIFIGYQAGKNELTDNKLVIDNSGTSDPLIYGDFTDGSENVKINGNFRVNGKAVLGSTASANGTNSFAIGSNVNAAGNGTIFLGDNSASTVQDANTDNRLAARFANGYRFYTNSALTSGALMNAGDNGWSSISDSTKKENFKSVNGEEFLGKISKFKLTSWNYKTQDSKTHRHYGPMAQDFYSAFGNDGIGTIGTDTTISATDFDGINFIAIQALEKRTKEQEVRIMELEKQNQELAKLNSEYKSDIEQIKNALNQVIANKNEIKMTVK
ncbi:MAG: tail fiber domain-containing protein [Ignavibacteriae bacterium]|nr:tail fiber domain-containing protein [Ignavibacteriota bacterium]